MSVVARKMQMVPSLADLLLGLATAPDIPVVGIASDSQLLANGYLFLACQGISSHGVDYVADARAAGASAIAWDSSTSHEPEDVGLPMIAVDNLGEHLGEIANRFYGSPSKAMGVIGVTGTNGKTTVAWMIAQCLQRLDEKCAYLGTIGYGIDELQDDDAMTTPGAVELHGRLAEFVDSGATHAAIEVSSHALSQRRVDGVRFEATLFTNLTRDHLDYHGDMQSYFATKVRLFLDYESRVRIINLDSEYGSQLAAQCGQDVVAVSTNFDRVASSNSFVFVRSVVTGKSCFDIAFNSSWGDGQFSLRLPGPFNIANATMVLAYLLRHGVPLAKACDVLALVEAPPGRMQRVAADSHVYVDYAHTPDAIESALKALRPHCLGKLWCVFGCGGDRDSGKRPLMGALAERLADTVVITNDNPRSEAPQKIFDEIVASFVQKDAAIVIEDRAAAIAWVVNQAASSDVILIAGKGHENYQLIGNKRRRFSDHSIAAAALKAKDGIA